VNDHPPSYYASTANDYCYGGSGNSGVGNSDASVAMAGMSGMMGGMLMGGLMADSMTGPGGYYGGGYAGEPGRPAVTRQQRGVAPGTGASFEAARGNTRRVGGRHGGAHHGGLLGGGFHMFGGGFGHHGH